tara:strand:+ start:813 stop:1478 length:666 start_codon:yes stop_codon:yes gene_type:complete
MVRARDKSPEHFGWQRIELKPNPKTVLYPLSWGILPIAFSVIMAFTGKGEQWIEWLGGFGIILFLVGGVSAVGPRQGSFNSMRVALGFFFCILALFSWVLVATGNLIYIYGIFSSLLALMTMYRSLDFIFKDAGLIYQINWHGKRLLPVDSMTDWDIRSARFSQNTMALKRFDSDTFAQIYGFRTKNGLVLRLDIFGIEQESRFDFRTLGVNFDDFSIEEE